MALLMIRIAVEPPSWTEAVAAELKRQLFGTLTADLAVLTPVVALVTPADSPQRATAALDAVAEAVSRVVLIFQGSSESKSQLRLRILDD